MVKCRLCLKNRKRLHSLFDATEEITYADIVATISNVKASKNDGFPEEICLTCSCRLKDVYEFKLLIERSHIELQKTYQITKISNNGMKDIKYKIEKSENDDKDAPKEDYEPVIFEKSLFERTTRLKRKCKDKSTVHKKLSNDDKDSITAKEFLESIKTDPDNDYDIVYEAPVDYDQDISDNEDNIESTNMDTDDEGGKYITMEYTNGWNNSKDEDYDPKKVKKNIKYKKKPTNKESIPKKIIKPVYLEDFRLIHAKAKRRPKKNVNTMKSKSTETKKDMCPICGKMVIFLKSHIITHGEKTVKCDLCPKSFYTEAALITHKKYHSGQRDYKCSICFTTFVKPELLKSHMRVHSAMKTLYPCENCGKNFKRKSALSRHLREVHNRGNIRTMQCDQCYMSFKNQQRLKHHLRVHTGERPFKCEICSQPYSYRADFSRHCFKKHGVFLKGRPINVMNAETLIQERTLMRDLMLRVQGVIQDENPTNPFEGPHACKALEQAVKALEANKIPVDL